MPEIKRLQIFKEVLNIIICCEKKMYVNVICLPTEHQGAQRTRSEVAVHSRIKLEVGNVGSLGEGKTGVPGEKPLRAD